MPCSLGLFGVGTTARRALRSRRASSPRRGRRGASRTSTPRSSTTSRQRVRTSRSRTESRAGSTGPTRSSTTLPFREPTAMPCSCSASSPTSGGAPFATRSWSSRATRRGARRHARSAARRVPHTRPAPVTGSASDQKLVEELGLAASRYEGRPGSSASSTTPAGAPTSHPRASGRRFPTTHRSPRARGPHSPSANGWRVSSARSSTSQTSSAPRPPTSSRSARRSRPTRRPRPTSRSSRRDADALGDELDVPSGDSLAAELTRFLREHEARRAEEEKKRT